jgi:hypothetical protein
MAKKKPTETAADATSTPKSTETKADKFVRLANRRVPRALKAIRAISNLAGRNTYDFSDEQAGQVVTVLIDAVNKMHERFKGSVAREPDFRL